MTQNTIYSASIVFLLKR